MAELDIIIPVYNEGEMIRAVLTSLAEDVKTPFRVLIAYDRDDDNTLPRSTPFAIRAVPSSGSRTAERERSVRWSPGSRRARRRPCWYFRG